MKLIRFRINFILYLKTKLMLRKINEINVDFEYNFVVVLKSIDYIHKVRCFVKNRIDISVFFYFCY